jgi:hypothetical protein
VEIGKEIGSNIERVKERQEDIENTGQVEKGEEEICRNFRRVGERNGVGRKGWKEREKIRGWGGGEECDVSE